MKKYSMIMMAFALLIGMAQCKKEQVTPSENNGVNITLKVDGGSEKLNVFPSTGAVVFTEGDSIFVGNNGKYVGTLKFRDGLFQGTISGDLSTNDFLHFYFVGNKPTSPTALSAGTTTYTVDISDQTAYLPAISYAPSKEKYSPTTTAYTAKLLNKSALVKFVPAEATNKPITVLGLNNEVQIDFEHNTLAPTGTTGGITLYSVSDTEKWAILLEQEAVPDATVTILGYNATTSVPAITNNMYYNSGVGISMTFTGVVYEINNSNWQTALASFNSEATSYPILLLTEDINLQTALTITRANGIIDFNGHTLHLYGSSTNELFIQNNVLGESLTFMNGTFQGDMDGAAGWSNFYAGTVVFENMTINGTVYTDGHHYEMNNVTFVAGSNLDHYTGGAGNPGTMAIRSGYYNCTFYHMGNYATKGTITIYGGKFIINPSTIANTTIATGYSVKSNTDPDSGTYPYIVSAD